jgi:hypothetical protein
LADGFGDLANYAKAPSFLGKMYYLKKQVVNTLDSNFIWEKDTNFIQVMASGIYQVFF